MSKDERSIKAFCTVELMVELERWSDNTTMKQIIEQAKLDAAERIERLFTEASMLDKDLPTGRNGTRRIRYCGVKKVDVRAIEANEPQ